MTIITQEDYSGLSMFEMKTEINNIQREYKLRKKLYKLAITHNWDGYALNMRREKMDSAGESLDRALSFYMRSELSILDNI